MAGGDIVVFSSHWFCSAVEPREVTEVPWFSVSSYYVLEKCYVCP
jgi:hypothetical protein